MKRIFTASAVMVLAAIMFVVAYKQASEGNIEYIEMEYFAMKVCMAVAVTLIMSIKIQEWFKDMRDWVKRPNQKR